MDLFNFVPDLYKSIIDTIHSVSSGLTGGEPMSKGLVTVGILSAIAVMLRNVPKKILNAFLGRFTVSLEFTNDWMGENRDLFKVAGGFVAEHQYRKNLKVFRAEIVDRRVLKSSITVASSSGLFLYGARPVYYSLEEAKEMGSVPETLTIRTFGRSANDILDMIKAQEKVVKEYHHRRFFSFVNKEWKQMDVIENDFPVWLPPEIKEELDRKIDFFKSNKDWYRKRGINHKLLIILSGPPGTGKSTIGRYVADRLGWSLGSLLSAGSLSEAVREAASREMVVSIPDVDAIGVGKNRGLKHEKKKEEPKPKDGSDFGKAGLLEAPVAEPEKPSNQPGPTIIALFDDGLAEALNLFQGDIPLNGSVVVMSTNNISELDSAMLRPGRCDLLLHIGNLGYEQVNDFRKHYYDTVEDLPECFKAIDLRACDVMESFTENAFDVVKFTEELRDRFLKSRS